MDKSKNAENLEIFIIRTFMIFSSFASLWISLTLTQVNLLKNPNNNFITPPLSVLWWYYFAFGMRNSFCLCKWSLWRLWWMYVLTTHANNSVNYCIDSILFFLCMTTNHWAPDITCLWLMLTVPFLNIVLIVLSV